MYNISYNPQEIQALIRLLDIAVKAGGMAIAGEAVVLQQKIVNAIQIAQKQTNETKEEVKAIMTEASNKKPPASTKNQKG